MADQQVDPKQGAAGTTDGAGAPPAGGATPKPGETPTKDAPAGSAKAGSAAPAGGAEAAGTPGEVDPDDAADELGITERNGKKFISMPYESFKRRTAKATRKELKAIFGTADKAAILATMKKYDDFKKEAETRKRETMSEIEKLKSDNASAISAKDLAERRASRMKEKVAVQKTNQVVERAAKSFVHPDKLEMAAGLFRSELIGMSKRRADKLVGHEADWFKEFAEKHPEFAKGAAATPADGGGEGNHHHEKKPATNGLGPDAAGKKPSATPPSKAGGKLVKDMSRAELNEYARSQGLSVPNDLRIIEPGGR